MMSRMLAEDLREKGIIVGAEPTYVDGTKLPW